MSFPVKRFLAVSSILSTGLLLNLLYVNAAPPSAFDILTRSTLPPGIPSSTKTSSQCLAPGEADNLSRWAKSSANTFSVELCNYEPFVNPVTVVRGNQYYVSGSGGSTFDCRRYRQNKAYSEVIRTASEQIVSYADRMLNSSNSSDRARGAKCLARVYLQWALQDGLGKVEYNGDRQPDFIQMWNAGALASTYARYRSQIEAESKVRKTNQGKTYDSVIKAWLKRTGDRVYAQIINLERSGSTHRRLESKRVNLGFWRAYSLLATAVTTQNVTHVKKSKEIFDYAMKEITSGNIAVDDKGFLPLELERRSRALSYHEFALQPIAGMANLSAAMSCDFLDSSQSIQKMALLIRKTTEGHRKPEVFAEASFCHVNGSCDIARVAPMSTFLQSATGNGEPYFPLITNGTHKAQIKSIIVPYLRSRGIQFQDSTGRSNVRQNLGGDIRFAPKYGSLKPTSKALRSYCK